jgi:hypothetical protein
MGMLTWMSMLLIRTDQYPLHGLFAPALGVPLHTKAMVYLVGSFDLVHGDLQKLPVLSQGRTANKYSLQLFDVLLCSINDYLLCWLLVSFVMTYS